MKLLHLNNAMGKLWGLRPVLSKWAYKGIVRPDLTYGAYVWAQVTLRKKAQEDLKKVNRLALVMMGNF